jgi:hypothetical protein
MVSIDVPERLAIVAGLNEHAGGAVVAAAPLRVMLLQESATPALKAGAWRTLMLDVADPHCLRYRINRQCYRSGSPLHLTPQVWRGVSRDSRLTRSTST